MTELSPEPNRVLTLLGLAAALTVKQRFDLLGLEASCDILEAVRVARNRRIVTALKDELEPVGWDSMGAPLYAHQLPE